ncbi:hypothetical protein, partial [Acidovorax sp.]|uniref:hypothetical protein n=1 Tax=Acidovorax sp. TaxID=1872122 RepID=UPI0025BD4C36
GPQGPANGPNGRRKRPQNPKNGVFRVRAGNFEGLFSVALVLVLLRAGLPIDFFTGTTHYYRVVPTEQSWFIAALPMGLGVLLILIARTLRYKSR